MNKYADYILLFIFAFCLAIFLYGTYLDDRYRKLTSALQNSNIQCTPIKVVDKYYCDSVVTISGDDKSITINVK